MARSERITYKEFRARYESEEACREELFRFWFSDGFRCSNGGFLTKGVMCFMFEYKFASIPVKSIIKSLLNPEYKMKYLETQWNALGKDGWEFCTTGYNALIFKREVKEKN